MMLLINKSLRSKLAMYFALGSLVTITIVAMGAYLATKNSLKQSVLDQLRTNVALKEDKLNQWFQTQHQDIIFLSQLPELQDQTQVLLNKQATVNQLLVTYDEVNQYFQELIAIKSNPREVSLLTNDGKVVFSTNQSWQGKTEPFGNITSDGSQNKTEFQSTFAIAELDNKAVITFATPISAQSQSGKSVGILAVTLDLGEIEDLVRQRTGLGKTGETYLVSPWVNNQNVLLSHLATEKEQQAQVSSFGIDVAIQGQDGIGVYHNHQGIPVLGVYRWLEAQNLALLGEISQHEAYQSARQLAGRILVIGLGCTGVLLMAVYWLSRRITKPLQALTQATAKLADGEFNYRTSVSSQDEIGILAQSFNTMAKQLLETFTNLEQNNQSLETQLQEQVTNSPQPKHQNLVDHTTSPSKQPLAPPSEMVNRSVEDGFILIVDDNPHNLSVLSETLKGAGFEVGVEMDGEGVLEQVAYAKPDLILLDVNMPGIDGFETCRLLKSNPQTQDIPIIFMTAWSETTDKVKGLSLGAVDYIPKPFEQEEVLARVRLHLRLSWVTKTLAQQNIHLQEAKQKAEAANKTKGQFLAKMSHELRTPLNAILGYAQILQRDLKPGKSVNKLPLRNNPIDGLRIIEEGGNHLLNLINEILDFAKIESSKIEINPSEVNLPTLLTGVEEMIHMRAIEKGLIFKSESQEDLPSHVQVDEKRLRQVLINLLSNAVKFTDTGSVTLRVKSTNPSASTVKICFEVIDTGVGIAAEHLEKIFQPFEQVGNNSSNAQGTGLGLSISRQLVELMGGQLQVESQLVRGSMFSFELVLPLVTLKQPQKLESATRVVGYQGQERKLLVVDDQPFNCSLLVDMLEPLGFEVLTAADGEQGFNLACQSQPDLILTDIFMPIKTGFALVWELQQTEKLKQIPIIALSASTVELVEQKSLLAGCVAFLPKPIEQQKLFSLLAKYLQLKWVYNKG